MNAPPVRRSEVPNAEKVTGLVLAALACECAQHCPKPTSTCSFSERTARVKKGEAVTVLYQWGHPFEHQLFDAPSPGSAGL